MNLYTTEEIADILKMKVTTIRALIRDKKLPAIKIGTEYRITEEDLKKFLDENRTM
jgi:excisionase family DNA binding protein